MLELVNLRQENTKTYDLGGNKRRLVASIGAIHYKNNYTDKLEQWKDIDLTWVGNRITKAPYELTLDGQKITVKDKKTGEVSTIELVDCMPPGLKWQIIPEYTRVCFRHVLPSDKVPFEAKFKVTGNLLFGTCARDDDGELLVEATLIGDILTEKLSEVRNKETGKLRPAKGNIRVDPHVSIMVVASQDDCQRRVSDDYFSITYTEFIAGYYNATYYMYGAAALFMNVTIPQGAIIDTACIQLDASQTRTETTVNTRLRAEATDNALAFSDVADFDARTWTTAYVYWDNIGSWTAGNWYSSAEIKTCIKEVIDRAGWVSGNALAILWDDFEDRSTHTATATMRAGYSYNGYSAGAPKLVLDYSTYKPGTRTAHMAAKLIVGRMI